MKYPIIENVVFSEIDSQLDVNFFTNPDIDWFKGHFEKDPILPGIASVSFVLEFLRQYMNIDLNYRKYTIPQLKFSKTVVPDRHYQCCIIKIGHEIKFRISELNTSAPTIVCSQGKINYE